MAASLTNSLGLTSRPPFSIAIRSGRLTPSSAAACACVSPNASLAARRRAGNDSLEMSTVSGSRTDISSTILPKLPGIAQRHGFHKRVPFIDIAPVKPKNLLDRHVISGISDFGEVLDKAQPRH